MIDYTEFDAALMTEIRVSSQDFTQLMGTRRLRDLATDVGATNRYGHLVDANRIFDRRLQALRKRGLIRYTAGRWEAV